MVASFEGHMGCLGSLLAASGVDVNTADDCGTTALIGAATEGHVDIVGALLAAPDIEVNAANQDGCTALMVAAMEGVHECVELLLAARGIDVNAMNRECCTPLWAAASEGHDRCVERLMAAPGVDAAATNDDGTTPLHIAATNNNVRCLELLLGEEREEAAVDINARNAVGATALWLAASRGNTASVVVLLSWQNIEVNETNDENVSPVFIAANQGHAATVSALLQDPAVDANEADMRNWTPVCGAVWHVSKAMGRLCDSSGSAASWCATLEQQDEGGADPARSLVLLLKSRRVNNASLGICIARLAGLLPSSQEVAAADAGIGQPLTKWHETARHIIPILEAQVREERRWCAHCLSTSPDQDLDLCSGCYQVGYCDRDVCQRAHWKEGGHKNECARLAALAAEEKEEKERDVGQLPNEATERNPVQQELQNLVDTPGYTLSLEEVDGSRSAVEKRQQVEDILNDLRVQEERNQEGWVTGGLGGKGGAGSGEGGGAGGGAGGGEGSVGGGGGGGKKGKKRGKKGKGGRR